MNAPVILLRVNKNDTMIMVCVMIRRRRGSSISIYDTMNTLWLLPP